MTKEEALKSIEKSHASFLCVIMAACDDNCKLKNEIYTERFMIRELDMFVAYLEKYIERTWVDDK